MGKQTIMIVDDEAGIRDIMEKYLVQVGYRITAVENGQQALDHLQSVNPDLILLDIEMPGIDGFTVCKKIRMQSTVPIIFLTVRRDAADREKCFQVGGNEFMTKPFNFETLESRIKEILHDTTV